MKYDYEWPSTPEDYAKLLTWQSCSNLTFIAYFEIIDDQYRGKSFTLSKCDVEIASFVGVPGEATGYTLAFFKEIKSLKKVKVSNTFEEKGDTRHLTFYDAKGRELDQVKHKSGIVERSEIYIKTLGTILPYWEGKEVMIPDGLELVGFSIKTND